MSGRRVAITALSGLGLLDALYMLAYHQGWIDSLVCPFFGRGCEKVGRSRHARHLGVPNAAVGAAGYAAMAGLALWETRRPLAAWQRLALPGLALAASAASVFLTWEQAARVRAWCFWCLSSTAINLALFPLTLGEARTARLRRPRVSKEPPPVSHPARTGRFGGGGRCPLQLHRGRRGPSD